MSTAMGLLCMMLVPAGANQPFAFGVEYIVPGLAKTYAETGATWGKTAPAGFDWGTIEPKPPVGGKHTYDFSFADGLLREYQDAGFRNFQIYLQVRNEWATSKPLPKVGHASMPPKPQYLPDYAAWLRAMVERYNGDGKNDMPGLKYPVRYWEIEAEWMTFWPASVKEYLDLLRAAHDTIKQADPEAQIILQGILLWGIFEGDPDAKEIEKRLSVPVWGPARRKILGDVSELLSHPELFDAVEFHSLSDWSDVFATVRFLRGEMSKHGYGKPIWAGDVNANINPMLWWNHGNYPYVDAQKQGILSWINAMKTPTHAMHRVAEKWFRAEQARFTAKKLLSFMGEGLAGANMGNMEDWGFFAVLPVITGSQGFCGLIDVKPIRRMDEPRVCTQRRPAFWTLKMLIGKLDGYGGAERLDLGTSVYAWRFHAPEEAAGRARSIVAIWYDQGKGLLPGDREPQVQVSLPIEGSRATVTPVITQIGQEAAQGRDVEVIDGNIAIMVGQAPLIVEDW
jgi:hypothetical protein